MKKTNQVRHANIRKKAVFIDQFIDHYNRIRHRTNFPHKAAKEIISLLFPNSKPLGKGAFKTTHFITSRSRKLVLKLSRPKNIRADISAYNRVPLTLRNRYCAKIYWITRYCLLQQYANKVKNISKKDPKLLELKKKLKKYGLTDIRPDNVGFVNRKLKVFDPLAKK